MQYFIISTIFYIAAECNPLSLQELCRGRIRYRLRENIRSEHADLETTKPILSAPQRQSAQQRTLRRFVIPIFEESDEALTDDEQEISGRARFLLNVDAHPGEAITTTLQLVRAVIQPNQNDSQSTENGQRVSNEYRLDDENFRDADEMNLSYLERQSRWESSNAKNPTSGTSADDTSAGHSSTTSADTNNDNNNRERSKRDAEKLVTAYSNMSESESDAEQENAFVQPKKIAKNEKMDENAIEDVNLRNEEGSSSSNTTYSEITDTTDTMESDVMEVDSPENGIYKSTYRSTYGSRAPSKGGSASREDAAIAHYTDSDAFATYMREKIQQLPLPFSVKLYMNYNRKL